MAGGIHHAGCGNLWNFPQHQQCHLLCPVETAETISQVCLPPPDLIQRQSAATFRLLLMLAVVDTIHLIASALTFSIANVSDNYSTNGWPYVVPYSLPIAQVCCSLYS